MKNLFIVSSLFLSTMLYSQKSDSLYLFEWSENKVHQRIYVNIDGTERYSSKSMDRVIPHNRRIVKRIGEKLFVTNVYGKKHNNKGFDQVILPYNHVDAFYDNVKIEEEFRLLYLGSTEDFYYGNEKYELYTIGSEKPISPLKFKSLRLSDNILHFTDTLDNDVYLILKNNFLESRIDSLKKDFSRDKSEEFRIYSEHENYLICGFEKDNKQKMVNDSLDQVWLRNLVKTESGLDPNIGIGKVTKSSIDSLSDKQIESIAKEELLLLMSQSIIEMENEELNKRRSKTKNLDQRFPILKDASITVDEVYQIHDSINYYRLTNRRDEFAIIDNQGKLIVPFSVKKLDIEKIENSEKHVIKKFERSVFSNFQLISLTGEMLLNEAIRSIEGSRLNDEIVYVFKDQNKLMGILNHDFQLFAPTRCYKTKVLLNKLIFRSEKYGRNAELSLNGNTILSSKDAKISVDKVPNTNHILVSLRTGKYNTKFLVNENGKLIVPQEYVETLKTDGYIK